MMVETEQLFNWLEFIDRIIKHDDKFIENNCIIDYKNIKSLLCPIIFCNPHSIDRLCIDYIENDGKLFEKCSNINRKDSKKSNHYRSKGNNSYGHGLWNQCLHFYSQSLQFAPVSSSVDYESESLPLAYGNRSAANFKLGRYESSLFDLHMAIKYGYGKFKSENKLRNRQIECLLRLNRMDEAKNISNEFGIDFAELNSKPIDNQIQKESEKMESETMEFRDKSNRIFSSKVRLSWNDQHGRGVWAGDETIKSGEIVLIERPYVHVLLSFFERRFCHHCCRRLLVDDQFEICHNCSNVSYCSHECQKNSWHEYHQYECSILPFLWQFGIGHLVYRLMAKTDIDLIVNTYQTFMNKSYEEIEQNLEPFIEPPSKSTLQSSTYSSLFSLQTHQNHTDSINLVAYRITATIIIELLFRTNRYQNQNNDNMNQKSDLKQILINVCFRHLCQTIINSHTIMVPSGDHDGGHSITPIATAFYPSLSLLNHSCDPNIQINYTNGIECIVRTNRTIQSNEQIYNCYGIDHCLHNYNERQQLLLDQYFFHCKCQICCLQHKKDSNSK